MYEIDIVTINSFFMAKKQIRDKNVDTFATH